MKRERDILDRHLRHWRESGLVSPELEARLRRASSELDQGRAGAVVRGALALLGGGLLLAGLILVIAENWAGIDRFAKLGGWAALQCAFLFAAWRLGERWPERPYLAEAFALLAGGWLLAGIALVSQIYHLDARPSNGLWFWLALVLPMAWALDRRAVAAVVFTALVAALALEVGERDSWVRAERAEGPWLWIGLPALAAFLVSLLPRPLASLRGWLGAWIFGAGQVFLLVLGSARELDRSDLGAAWVVAGAGLGAALALPGRVLPTSWGDGTARLILALTVSPWLLLGRAFERGVILDEIAIGVAWIVQLAVAILVIRAGAAGGSRAWVNLGYLALLAGILTRYFDFFGDYLSGGAALGMMGLLMLFVLYALEKARRRTLQREVTA